MYDTYRIHAGRADVKIEQGEKEHTVSVRLYDLDISVPNVVAVVLAIHFLKDTLDRLGAVEAQTCIHHGPPEITEHRSHDERS